MKTPIAALAVLAAGCASGGSPPRSHDAADLFRTATVEAPVRPPVEMEPAAGARDGVSIEVRFETSKGETVVAPRLTTFHGQRAKVQVVRQTSYVADFDVERKDDAFIVDPVVKIAPDGVFLEMTARPGTRGSVLAYSIRVARLQRPLAVETYTDLQGNRLSLQLPTWDRTEAEGLRGMEDGVWGLLARLPYGKGEFLTVLARVAPEKLEFTSKDEEARDIGLIDPGHVPAPEPAIEGNSLPDRAARAALPEAPAGSLDLRAITLVTDLPPGSVAEAGAVALDAASSLDRGEARMVTGLVPGARLACLLDETFMERFVQDPVDRPVTVDPVPAVRVSGLTGVVGEDGSLGLSWTTTPRWERFSYAPAGDERHLSVEKPWSETWKARVVPGEGPRLVVLAALPGGRAAGVLVRFRQE
jgi:hypothetical protein